LQSQHIQEKRRIPTTFWTSGFGSRAGEVGGSTSTEGHHQDQERRFNKEEEEDLKTAEEGKL